LAVGVFHVVVIAFLVAAAPPLAAEPLRADDVDEPMYPPVMHELPGPALAVVGRLGQHPHFNWCRQQM
jgi:hypothetical protein